MKHILSILFVLTVGVSSAQTLTATDMMTLTGCKNQNCFNVILKEKGFKFIPDTGAVDTSRNKSYIYLSKHSVDTKKHKNKVVMFTGNNGMYCGAMFTTKIDKMYRQLINSFTSNSFAEGARQFGFCEEQIQFSSYYYPGFSLQVIISKDLTGTKILRYDVVLTHVRTGGAFSY